MISETYDRYGGIYVGASSRPDVKEKVEATKLLLSIGSIKSDFNTGSFTYRVPLVHTIELHSTSTQIGYASYPGIGMKKLLPKLTERLLPFSSRMREIPVSKFSIPEVHDVSEVITHEWLWPRMGKFFQAKDIVIAETGTSSFGVLDVPFPQDAVFVSQILWGSIGWSVGSTLGASLAGKEMGLNRTILFVGDGSLQLTIQEVSCMIRSGVTPILFVLNNSGYTIERFLHGETRKYNDISNWKWTSLLSVLGGEEGKSCQSYSVKTRKELSRLLDDPSFSKAKRIQLVEIVMDKMDAPRALKLQAELSNKANVYAEPVLTAVP